MSRKSSSAEYIGNELQLFKLATNWKTYWSAKIRPMLGSEVLEVGAGVGTNTALLYSQQSRWLALEPDQAQCAEIREAIGGKNIDVVAGYSNDLPAGTLFDTIIYIDVLEHIEKDREELLHAMTLLKEGGRLIVLSPAHQALYSPFDKAVGHFRRYSKQSLTAIKPDQAQVEQLYYLDSIGCIASWVNAKLMRSSMPTKSQIWFWDKLMVPISKLFDRILAYRVGKTIVMVLAKKS